MPPSTNVLDEARALFTKRLAELDDERKRLERALADLGGSKKAGRRGSGRPRGSTSTSTSKKAPPAGVADVAVAPVPTRQSASSRANPGITASEIAKTMKIKPNYLYRVLGDLEKEGRVKKKGRSTTPPKRSDS